MTVALITGASSGIGAAFARRLAQLGYDLVLVARDAERLHAASGQLHERWRVEVEVVVADLATEEGCAKVESRLRQQTTPVDLLVNNAGFGLGAGVLHSDVDDEERMLRVMAVAPMRLTKAALPAMVERGRGSIVTVSSVAALVGRNSYGAVKTWALRFSETLSLQLAGTGVRAIALCPGLVHTEFHQRGNVDASAAPRFLWLDADRVVDECLRDLARGKSVSIPSKRYRVLVAVGQLLPMRLTARVAQNRGLRRHDR